MNVSLNDLLDAYEAATGMRASGSTVDRLGAALDGSISDVEWGRLPYQVRNLLDPASVEHTLDCHTCGGTQTVTNIERSTWKCSRCEHVWVWEGFDPTSEAES